MSGRMWEKYYTVSSVEEVLKILDKEGSSAKIIAGGTDLVLELKKKMHSSIDTLIDINRIEDLDFVSERDGIIYIGPNVTHNKCIVEKILLDNAMPLVKAAHSIGAPQIRNVGTVLGNLITASPANDTIPPLIALDASLTLRSVKEERIVKLSEFYSGVRRTCLRDNEMVVDVHFNKMSSNQRGSFNKYLLRQTHAISVANTAVILTFDDEKIIDARIALGAVAPTIIRASKAEAYLIGKKLNSESIQQAAILAGESAEPITDVRATLKYRNHIISILVEQALHDIYTGKWKDFPINPILLWGRKHEFFKPISESFLHDRESPIHTSINGKSYIIQNGQNNTLANLIRKEAHLTGTKIGCGEGECGACTVYMNELPVFSCLIPAPRAHQCEISTIEGVATEGRLHPVQQAFIDEGAVQCGFCTPGFVMSAIKLLEEKPSPRIEDIKQGLAGNLCRCTGYYSIISAVEKAAHMIQSEKKTGGSA